MAVVKANAYGHGIVPIAKQAEQLGVDYFGVACMYEARELRHAGIKTPILLLGYTDVDSLDETLRLDLSINVMDSEVLSALSHKAKKIGKKATIHVKIDSGMHRLGVMPNQAEDFIKEVIKKPNIFLEGIFTHFADADSEDLGFTYHQLAVFDFLINKLKADGICPPLIHAANSAAVLRVPKSHFTMVRTGKILYGPLPGNIAGIPYISKPVLTLETKIVQLRTIPKGESVGYGRKYITDKTRYIAAIPVGYADGFRRNPNFREVLVRGKKAPLIGNVSMDQASIDVSEIPHVTVGDRVVLIGKQGREEITTEDIASKLKTINYEVLTSLSQRIQRLYL